MSFFNKQVQFYRNNYFENTGTKFNIDQIITQDQALKKLIDFTKKGGMNPLGNFDLRRKRNGKRAFCLVYTQLKYVSKDAICDSQLCGNS